MSNIKSDHQWMSGGAHQDIVTVGDPLLRRQSEMAKDTGQAKLLGERMVSLLRELKGAGLAAPQIGTSKRIVVVEVRKTDLFPDRPESPLYVMINPAIVETSENLDEGVGRLFRRARFDGTSATAQIHYSTIHDPGRLYAPRDLQWLHCSCDPARI